MTTRNPYEIIKHLRVTEKSMVLENLKNNTSNKSVTRYRLPKYVFEVDSKATKGDVKWAVEEIYHGVRVKKVNTLNTKPKLRRVRGKVGYVSGFKKAYVTLSEGDNLETE